jgi:hypothetical protein
MAKNPACSKAKIFVYKFMWWRVLRILIGLEQKCKQKRRLVEDEIPLVTCERAYSGIDSNFKKFNSC